MTRALLLVFALAPSIAGAQAVATAQSQPQVQVTIDPKGPVTVGNPVTVTLTLLVPTYMPQPPVWPDMQLADAITRQLSDGSRPVTTRIGGESWAGISHAYQITPQRGADYALPAGKVTVTYADPTTNAPVTVDVPVPEIDFSAVIPKGAEGLDPFVSAQSLTLAAKVDGADGKPLKPGDAVTLTVTVDAQGTQAMLLPSLLGRLAPPAGLHAYPKEPAITDTPGERGDPDTGRRIEAVTYIIEKPGTYDLPALKLDWWNAADGKVEHATTDPVHFKVPVPAGWSDQTASPSKAYRRPLIVLALMVLAAAAIYLLAAPYKAWRKRHDGSEPVAYRRLRRAVAHASVPELRPAVRNWLALRGEKDMADDLDDALCTLERSVYGLESTPITRKSREALLEALERHHGASTCTSRKNGLPDLNPWRTI